VAEAEADHFGNCRGPYLDVRDLAQMLAHVHDAEIEISEGPEPRRAMVHCNDRDLSRRFTVHPSPGRHHRAGRGH
jgi:hypothetical protein